MRAGKLTEDEAANAQAHSEANRTHYAEALVELYGLSGTQIAEFTRRKLMIPYASGSLLARVQPNLTHCIPADLARRYTILPISVDHLNNVTLAMADPTDVRAVKVVHQVTGGYVIRAAAPICELQAAITRCFGPDPVNDKVNTTLPRPEDPPLQSPLPEAPAVNISISSPGTPVSPESLSAVLPQIESCTNRDQLITYLAQYLHTAFGRVMIFVHTHGELKGHSCLGELNAEGFRQIAIPTDEPSVFSQVLNAGRMYFGQMPADAAIDVRFSQALGGITGNVLLMPVILGTKTPLLVFAHPNTSPVDPSSIEKLSESISNALRRALGQMRSN